LRLAGERASLRPLHFTVVLICMLINVLDGFDLMSIAFTAPRIMNEWRVGAFESTIRRLKVLSAIRSAASKPACPSVASHAAGGHWWHSINALPTCKRHTAPCMAEVGAMMRTATKSLVAGAAVDPAAGNMPLRRSAATAS
jgi:hypothetical protein